MVSPYVNTLPHSWSLVVHFPCSQPQNCSLPMGIHTKKTQTVARGVLLHTHMDTGLQNVHVSPIFLAASTGRRVLVCPERQVVVTSFQIILQ